MKFLITLFSLFFFFNAYCEPQREEHKKYLCCTNYCHRPQIVHNGHLWTVMIYRHDADCPCLKGEYGDYDFLKIVDKHPTEFDQDEFYVLVVNQSHSIYQAYYIHVDDMKYMSTIVQKDHKVPFHKAREIFTEYNLTPVNYGYGKNEFLSK